MTKEAYLSSLRKLDHRVFIQGEKVEGETINRFTHIQQSVEDLTKKILMLREMGRKTACCFQRCAGLDCMNTV